MKIKSQPSQIRPRVEQNPNSKIEELHHDLSKDFTSELFVKTVSKKVR